jgi:hypothetical protein
MGEFGAENDPRATTEGCGVLGRGATRETTSIVPSNQLLPECILLFYYNNSIRSTNGRVFKYLKAA